MTVAAVALLAAVGCASGSPGGVGVPPHLTATPPYLTTGGPRPTTAAPNSPGAKRGTFGDGTYAVGETFKAGTYRAPAPGPTCYWVRLKGFSGSGDDIIALGVPSGPAVVTIAPTDKGFQTSGCGTWTPDLSRITKSKTSFGPGTYIVKTDIDPGTYSAPGGDLCIWERLKGFGGTGSDILALDVPRGRTIVKIETSDKGFESRDCGTFTSSSEPAPGPTTEGPEPTEPTTEGPEPTEPTEPTTEAPEPTTAPPT